MNEYKVNIPDMIKLMPDMYNLLWDFTGEAKDKYGDLELIKIFIAGKVSSRSRPQKQRYNTCSWRENHLVPNISPLKN